MESRFQTSFIPKKPMVNEPTHRPRVVNLFALLGVLIFLITASATAGVYLYTKYLETNIAASKETINSQKQALDPELVKQIVRLDNRIKTARKLIDSHLAVSHLFDQLGQITIPSVRFKKFDFSFLGKDKVTVEMTGQSTGFSAVALQSDVINNSPLFINPMIGGLGLEPAGTVAFGFSSNIDSSSLYFKKNAQADSAPVISEPVKLPEVIVAPVSTSTATTTKK